MKYNFVQTSRYAIIFYVFQFIGGCSSFRIPLTEILSVHITIEGPSQLILLEFNIKFKFHRSPTQTKRPQKLPFIKYLPFYVYRARRYLKQILGGVIKNISFSL